MEFLIHTIDNQNVAEVTGDQIVLHNVQDALDLIANASYAEATAIMLKEQHLSGDFYDLRSGLAGEILQKCANYRMKLAVIGDFDRYTSKSLHAFIVECNRGGAVAFVSDRQTALAKLAP